MKLFRNGLTMGVTQLSSSSKHTGKTVDNKTVDTDISENNYINACRLQATRLLVNLTGQSKGSLYIINIVTLSLHSSNNYSTFKSIGRK